MDADKDNHFSEEERKLLDLLPKKFEHDVGEVAEALGVSSEEIIVTAASLSKKGYRIGYDAARNTLRLIAEEESTDIEYPDVGKALNRFCIGFISETRIGSKQEQIRLLKGVYKEFERIGVDFIVMVGNLTVGKPDSRSSLTSTRQDTFLFSAQEQRDFVIKHFPTAGKKIKTYIIAGRRDLTFRGKKAYSIIQDICQRRPDFVYWGDKTRTFEVKGLRITVANPYDDNGPHGKTYGVQQIADSLDDPHPNVLLVAGMHRYGFAPDYWNDGRGYVCLVPSLHSQMARQSNKRAPVRPDVGFGVLDIDFNELDPTGMPKIQYTGYNLNPYADCSGSEHFEPYPEYTQDDLEANGNKIIRWLHDASEFGITMGEISRRLKKNKKAVELEMANLQKRGYPIKTPPDTKRFVLQRKIRSEFPAKDFHIEREVSSGSLSDTHLTSTHQQVKLLRRAYGHFSERGISYVFHSGDLSEGSPSSGYRGHGRDVVGSNPDELLDYVSYAYPELKLTGETKTGDKNKRGKTFAIGGNHDAWYITSGGLDFVMALSRVRRNIIYLGSESGAVIIDGIFYYLNHPRGAAGDTLSRKLETHIRRARNRMSKGKEYPRVMLLGNWHRAFAMFDRDILGFLVPCMKYEDTFHTTLALVPQLGYWIINVGLDENENIIKFNPEYFGFLEQDIDREDYKDIYKWHLRKRRNSGAHNKDFRIVPL